MRAFPHHVHLNTCNCTPFCIFQIITRYFLSLSLHLHSHHQGQLDNRSLKTQQVCFGVCIILPILKDQPLAPLHCHDCCHWIFALLLSPCLLVSSFLPSCCLLANKRTGAHPSSINMHAAVSSVVLTCGYVPVKHLHKVLGGSIC